jgi:hypothetical protein
MGIVTQKAIVTSWHRHSRDIKIFKIKLKRSMDGFGDKKEEIKKE